MNDLPPALRPIYTTDNLNQNILLYKGAFEISVFVGNRKVSIKGYGNVGYKWLPIPRIKFYFRCHDDNQEADLAFYAIGNGSPVSLTISDPDLKISLEVFVEQSSFGDKQENFILGEIKEPIDLGNSRNLSSVLFHVVNFHDFRGRPPSILKQENGDKIYIQRLVFKAENWKITLDQVANTSTNINYLKLHGGFAITHVGKLEKIDGQIFTGEEARDFLKKFTYFLSFARGFRIPILFLIGYDIQEKEIWEYWEESNANLWKNVNSWCPKGSECELKKAFPGFLRWWQNWEGSARTALDWYLEANYNSLCEQRIILVQVALELIVWVIFVEKDKTISNTRFSNLRASDKLRQLFSRFSIPLEIPGSSTFLNDLRQFASNSNWEDGAHTLTEMRNALVHPKTNKRNHVYDAAGDAKIGAGYLGIWYLELTLLAIFKYDGLYQNCLNDFIIEDVPWYKQE